MFCHYRTVCPEKRMHNKVSQHRTYAAGPPFRCLFMCFNADASTTQAPPLRPLLTALCFKMSRQMNIYRKPYINIAFVSFIFSLVVSVTMTALDWSINPSNLFYSQEATNWGVLFQTFGSWFLPLLPVVIISLSILFYLVSKVYSYVSRFEYRPKT